MKFSKWTFLQYIITRAARRQGFLDPIELLARLRSFAQPSEVGEPVELLRAGVVLFAIPEGGERILTARIPLPHKAPVLAENAWPDLRASVCTLQCPDRRYQALYNAAITSLILHSPDDVYPGPSTYRHFWFRDAVYIIHALLCMGLEARAARALSRFPERQTQLGYFRSQEGEWDSNGEVLWILHRYQQLTGKELSAEWHKGSPVLFGPAPTCFGPVSITLNPLSDTSIEIVLMKKHIPEDAFVVGHMGRLAPEKNLEFLARSVVAFMKEHGEAVFLLVGSGPSQEAIEQIFAEAGMAEAFSMAASARKALAAYENLQPDPAIRQHEDEFGWDQIRARIKAEWDILKTVAEAGDEALSESVSASDQEMKQ